jgi:hypothetical protein
VNENKFESVKQYPKEEQNLLDTIQEELNNNKIMLEFLIDTMSSLSVDDEFSLTHLLKMYKVEKNKTQHTQLVHIFSKNVENTIIGEDNTNTNVMSIEPLYVHPSEESLSLLSLAENVISDCIGSFETCVRKFTRLPTRPTVPGVLVVKSEAVKKAMDISNSNMRFRFYLFLDVLLLLIIFYAVMFVFENHTHVLAVKIN